MRRFVFLFLLGVLAFSPLTTAQNVPLFTEDFPPEEFNARREAIYDAIGPDAIALLQGAPSPRGYTRFRQTNEFYYLTGVEAPHALVVLDGSTRSASIYLPHRHERREAGEGKMLSAEDAAFMRDELGFADTYGPELLAEHLVRFTRRGMTVFTPFSPAEGLAESRDLGLRVNADIASDPWDGRPSREANFIDLLETRFTGIVLADLTPALDALRLIKSERELALIRKATRLSGLSLMEAMRSTVPGIKEQELDAVARFIYHRHGAQGDAYYALVATGTNAFFPHYHKGKSTLKDGELILMDYAPDVGYYMSDVTRMWPVNGRFNRTQRELYGFYLACYSAILKHIRPNATPAQIRRDAVVDMEAALAAATFSQPNHRAAAAAFVDSYRAASQGENGRLGHWVGMATHDVGDYYGPLKPGMVFTIEPALRVPEEMIYIRLEDLIIITETGAEIVSDFVPMDIPGVERLMEESGLLQDSAKELDAALMQN
ncbi:MAG: Xaa-Pro peptidase family protein [Rhodothermales bacterium]|nr:Xaa-Pro peptidase family protein [Rhodothermales bacterium]